jgi:hypothetical protein
VNQGDPFASCPAPDDGTQGVLFPATEPEVWLAANPADSKNLIGVFQQDRWSDVGAQGDMASYSTDGGHNWKQVALPFSSCAASTYSGNTPLDPFRSNRPYNRASDPWVSVGPDGTAYAVGLSFMDVDATTFGGAIVAATSSDGGQTWQNLRTLDVQPNDDRGLFDDKVSVTADPVHAGTAYVVWDQSVNVPCFPGDSTNGCTEYNGFFSKTTDAGQHWSTPSEFLPVSANEDQTGNEIVVDPNTGRLYDFYAFFDADNNLTVEEVSSTNGGSTWSPRQVVSADGWLRRNRSQHRRRAPDSRLRPGAGDRPEHRPALRRLARREREHHRPESGRALHLDLDRPWGNL